MEVDHSCFRPYLFLHLLCKNKTVYFGKDFSMHVFDDRIEFVGDNDSLLIIPYASIKYCTHGRFESETIPGTINSFVKIKTQKMLLQLIDIYFKDQGLAQKIFNIIKRKTSVYL